MKTILLCTDGSSFAEKSYYYGSWLAHRLSAEVSVLFVTDIRSQQVASTGNLSGSIGIGSSQDLLKKLVDLEHEKAKINNQRAKFILEKAKKILSNTGLNAINLIHKTGFLVDCFHEFDQDADLVVLGKRGEAAEFASGHLGANLERIVRSSKKPCFVTSRNYHDIERVLVAYDGSKTGKKMLDFLITSPIFKDLEIHVVTIAKTADDPVGISRIEEARHQLQDAGINPVCSLQTGDPEKVMGKYVEDYNIHLLVMGAYGHSRIRHLVIGSTTAQMLRESNIPVLLYR
ncbi:universal stress protein [Geitlerinema sp. P-1104]|uniref:universal stress protein n=1 Tax=Geitlerinema sp. P-1104 TaxID=2546230 RepID=UPI0014772614|nr:universal stress protein [Geitlerinema sp. P-1104]NMG58432.1 universal stress protein [Geitlerinema sp. P-1104]